MSDINDPVEFEKLWQEPYVWDEESIKWLNTRPQMIIDMILKFPPDTKVKATRPLMVPRFYEVGIVVSHFENGLISVVVPGGDIKAQCEPGWLEVVEYRKGMTPDDIRERLN